MLAKPSELLPRKTRGDVGTLVVTATALLVAVMVPLAGSYSLYVLGLVAVQLIAVLSLNLLMGYAGQISLGQAAFVGIGAYAAAQLADWGLPFPLTLVGAAIVGAAAAAVVGLPSLRIRGLQIAAATLAFGVAAEQLLFTRPWAEQAVAGVIVERPALIAGDRAFLVLALLLLAAVLALDSSVRSSRLGRAFLAVRDREDTAAAKGIRVGPTKVAAYAMSGFYAGIAGGLHAYLLERVTPGSFSVWVSIGYVAIVVVGGLGSWRGVAVAAVAFTALPEVLRSAAEYAPLAGAVLLMLVPVLRPEGLRFLLDRPLLPRRTDARKDGTRPKPPQLSPSFDLSPPVRPVWMTVPVRTLLHVDDLSVSFDGLRVLDGVGLEVRRHQTTGLIGPNGAGKTTLFNCISGFVRPRGGTVLYRGRNLLELPPEARVDMGIARTFQQVGLSRRQSVRENVLMAQHARCGYGTLWGLTRLPPVGRGELDLARRVESSLELMGLRDLADRPVGSLPGGQQRLVEVAAALASSPELLLLDEPAAGMSPEEAAELVRHLAAVRSELGVTMLVIEHHLPLIADLCDHVYVLETGRMLAEGTPAALQKNPAVVATYLGGAPPKRAKRPRRPKRKEALPVA